jgi:hypothetical protein
MNPPPAAGSYPDGKKPHLFRYSKAKPAWSRLRTADQNSGCKYEKATDHDLKGGGSSGVSMKRLRTQAMIASSMATTPPAIVVAVQNAGIM